MLSVITAPFVLLLVFFATGISPAIASHRASHSLARLTKANGRQTGVAVWDLDSKRMVFSYRANVQRIPASVTKLFTASTALTRWEPDHRFRTEVLATAPPDEVGVVDGNIYLRGGGDPTLCRKRLRHLANELRDAGIVSVTGRVIGDESAFDLRRGGPGSGWATSGWVGPLSALAFNRGRNPGGRPWFQASPAKSAAQVFATELEHRHIEIGLEASVGVTPTTATPLAELSSPPIRNLVRSMNVPSDNYIAELLVKAIGREFSSAGTTTSGVEVVRSTVRNFNSNPHLVDGSGLARSNRVTATDVIRVLNAMQESKAASSFWLSLPMVGLTGTVRKRMRGTPAARRCRAKTGTLRNVSALAGYCHNASGRRYSFAFLMNGAKVHRARMLQDKMTVAIARM